MTTTLFGRRISTARLWIFFLVGVLLTGLAAGDIYFLKVEDAKAVATLTHLRKTDPADYLEDVRHHQGFRTYLAQVRQKYGFDRFNRDVPMFLLGRWALLDQPKRVGYQYIAEDCSRFLAIEDGEIKLRGNHLHADYPARYRISGSTVEADLGGGTVLPISLVSFGMDLHHIVVTLPRHKKPLYGYLCK